MSLVRYYLPHTVSDYAMYGIGMARCYLQGYINNTFSANEISPRIFVGDLASASNSDAMKEQGITHILSIFNGGYEMFPEEFAYKLIHINDDEWIDIGEHFEESNQFIHEALNNTNNKIMIHCQRGVSRSVTLLIAYLLWRQNEKKHIAEDEIEETINKILKNVQTHRPIAGPNGGFIKCLRKYVCSLNGYEYRDSLESVTMEDISGNNTETNTQESCDTENRTLVLEENKLP